ncbi:hypothetical protein BS78_06G165700 [Paspalum vaginatum]|nr:hypothetical protein BS78_06G165700 [Paspalum vaginatum]
MHLFSGRSKKHKSKCQQTVEASLMVTTTWHRRGKCRALCCGGSRLSMSASASCSSAEAVPKPLQLLPRGLSKLVHGMVQAWLQDMIDMAAESDRTSVARCPDELRRPWRVLRRSAVASATTTMTRAAGSRRWTTCVVLPAEDRRRTTPRRSIAEVSPRSCRCCSTATSR